MTKEEQKTKILKVMEQSWEKIDRDLAQVGGVNVYSYKLGFMNALGLLSDKMTPEQLFTIIKEL